jgi:hypothetical protein
MYKFLIKDKRTDSKIIIPFQSEEINLQSIQSKFDKYTNEWDYVLPEEIKDSIGGTINWIDNGSEIGYEIDSDVLNLVILKEFFSHRLTIDINAIIETSDIIEDIKTVEELTVRALTLKEAIVFYNPELVGVDEEELEDIESRYVPLEQARIRLNDVWSYYNWDNIVLIFKEGKLTRIIRSYENKSVNIHRNSILIAGWEDVITIDIETGELTQTYTR